MKTKSKIMDKCIYFHINSNTQEVFYVGQGNLMRAYNTNTRNIIWHRYTKKHNYYVSIIHTELTAEQANEKEIAYIKQFGRKDLGLGTLVNLTDGGTGVYGFDYVKREKPDKSILQVSKDRKKIKRLLLNKGLDPEELTSEELDQHILDKKNKKGLWKNKLKVEVDKLDLEDNFISKYETVTSAAEANNCAKSHITECIKGRRNTTGGFKWRYSIIND